MDTSLAVLLGRLRYLHIIRLSMFLEYAIKYRKIAVSWRYTGILYQCMTNQALEDDKESQLLLRRLAIELVTPTSL